MVIKGEDGKVNGRSFRNLELFVSIIALLGSGLRFCDFVVDCFIDIDQVLVRIVGVQS